MTEAQIEARVERMVDELDRQYMTTAMTADHYHLRMRQIDEWAWMRGYEARLEAARHD
jgi:hypothetical protein